MSRLPTPGGDDNQWGGVLNDFLSVEHNADGTLKKTATINAKADDDTVVHLANAETISGAKNFSGGLYVDGEDVVTANDARLSDDRMPLFGSVDITKFSTMAGSDGQVLTADGSRAGGLRWATPSTFSGSTTDLPMSIAPTPSGGDDLAALQAALPSNGVLMLQAGTYQLSGMLVVPDGVDIQGQGGSMTNPATTIKCTSSGAGVSIVNTGGISGGLTIDGDNVATTPFLRLAGAQRTFINLSVISAAQDNWTVLESQNDIYVGCNSQYAARDNLVIDKGAGGLLFDRFESNGPGRYGLRMDNQVQNGGGYVIPTHIQFMHCIFERAVPNGSATSAVILNSYDVLAFKTCVFTSLSDTNSSSLTGPIIDITSAGQVNFEGGYIIGDTSKDTGMRVVNGAYVVITSAFRLHNLLNGIQIVSGNPQIQVIGTIAWQNVTNRYAGGSPDTSVRMRTTNPLEISRESTADTVLTSSVSGDNGIRFLVTAGGALGFGNGTSYTPQAYLYGGGQNVLTMPAAQTLLTGNGDTAARPAATSVPSGGQWFDTTLHKPIWSDGTAWRDASGTVV